jgi:hypothetical protein
VRSCAARRAVDGRAPLDDAPRSRAVAAGVHRQRAADGAGNAGEELGAFQIVHRGEARHLRAGDAGLGVTAPTQVPAAVAASVPDATAQRAVQ